MWIGNTRYNEHINIVIFSSISFRFTLIKQATLYKQISIHKNTCHKYLVYTVTNAWYTHFLTL